MSFAFVVLLLRIMSQNDNGPLHELDDGNDGNHPSFQPWYARYGWFLLGALCICVAVLVGFVGMLVGIDESFAARSFYKVAFGFFLAALLGFAIGTVRAFTKSMVRDKHKTPMM